MEPPPSPCGPGVTTFARAESSHILRSFQSIPTSQSRKYLRIVEYLNEYRNMANITKLVKVLFLVNRVFPRNLSLREDLVHAAKGGLVMPIGKSALRPVSVLTTASAVFWIGMACAAPPLAQYAGSTAALFAPVMHDP